MHVISPNKSPGPSSATGFPYARSTDASIGIVRSRVSSADIRIPRRERAGQLLEKPLRSALRFHMRNGRRKRNPRFAFENVKRRRTEFALAANNLPRMKSSFDDGSAVQLKKCP